MASTYGLYLTGYGGIEKSVCQGKGCCYIPAPATTGAALLTLPACFYPNGGDSSFSLSGGLQASGIAICTALQTAARGIVTTAEAMQNLKLQHCPML